MGGIQLEFLILNMPGETQNSTMESGTFAILTMANRSQLVLESQLHIMVSAKYMMSTIVCHNNAHGVNKSITFSLGKPETCHP